MEAEDLFHCSNRGRIWPLKYRCIRLPKPPSKYLGVKGYCQVPYRGPVCLSDSDERTQEPWSPKPCQTFRGFKPSVFDRKDNILRERSTISSYILILSGHSSPALISHVTALVLLPPVILYPSFAGVAQKNGSKIVIFEFLSWSPIEPTFTPHHFVHFLRETACQLHPTSKKSD